MSHPNTDRDERVRSDECLVSTHEFKLHDWRWLAWPLSNTSARGRWCRLCGLVQGVPEGQCQTVGCLEYAAGGNDFCEFCQHRQTINNAATRMRDHCIETVKEYWQRIQGEDDEGMRELLFGALVVRLENLKLEGDNSRTKPQPDSIATRMRDRCVEKVASLPLRWMNRTDIVAALKSITLTEE